MLDEDRYCIDVLTQISSTTRALQGVAMTMLEDHVRHCVRDAIDQGPETADAKVDEASRSSTASSSADRPARRSPPRATDEDHDTDEASVASTYRVPDISCGHCKQAIESEVGQVDGVESASWSTSTSGRHRGRQAGETPSSARSGGRLRGRRLVAERRPRRRARAAGGRWGRHAPSWISSICHLP
jgi:hypothetical protein